MLEEYKHAVYILLDSTFWLSWFSLRILKVLNFFMFEAEAVEQSESEQTVNGPLLHTGTVTCFLGMHGGYM